GGGATARSGRDCARDSGVRGSERAAFGREHRSTAGCHESGFGADAFRPRPDYAAARARGKRFEEKARSGAGDREGYAGKMQGPIGSGKAAARIGDRKSTRLNSSHGSISYAVFCLKKKKTNSYILE